ncbi:MAG: hypothetical protein ABR946_01355 [Solirubrobacteraceae bacterium]|jgi:predicted enzyme related to lactoylglutathione lyase
MDPVVRFEAAGGKLSGPTQDIPGVGLHSVLFDFEGDRPSMRSQRPPATSD